MTPSQAVSAAVEVENLTVRFGDFTAVRDVSFSVSQGEIFGFLGANGAGKTTTIRVLCGLLVPSAGTVRVAGLEFLQGTEDTIKQMVGYMSQKFTLYEDLTVAENLAFAAALRKLSSASLSQRTRELFSFIEFNRDPRSLVRDLPGGIRQQVSLAAALLHDPRMIFLDEPTAGVTPAARARFWQLIRKLAASGKTIFVTTHYMDEAEQCDRIALMRAGEIIALDSPTGLKQAAFPEPLYEVDPPEHSPMGWVATLRAWDGLEDLQPHGMRYHLVLRTGVSADALRTKLDELLPLAGLRAIPPSLENVFIRLVEGGGR